MAVCTKQQAFYGCSNLSGTTCVKVAVTSYVPDTLTAVNACNYVLVDASEYSQLSHGYITTAADAQTIAFSLVLLLAIGFGIRAIRSALNTYDNSIDEKH